MTKKDDEDPLSKLMQLTKLMKAKKVKVSRLGPVKTTNKWRSQEPKFAPKAAKSKNVVQVGSMEVDPSLQQEYENWRKDKLAEQAERRAQAERKAQAEKKARKPPLDY